MTGLEEDQEFDFDFLFEFNQSDEGAVAAPAGGCAAGRGRAADPGREGPVWRRSRLPPLCPGRPPASVPPSAAPGQKTGQAEGERVGGGGPLWGRRVALPTGLGSGHRPGWRGLLFRARQLLLPGDRARGPRGEGGQGAPTSAPSRLLVPSALKPPAPPRKVPGEAAFRPSDHRVRRPFLSFIFSSLSKIKVLLKQAADAGTLQPRDGVCAPIGMRH